MSQGPRAERPTYAPGEKWIRNDGVYELIRIENDRYIFAAGPGQEIHLTKDLVVARAQWAHLAMEFDPPPELSWPLEVGKWGITRGVWRSPGLPPYDATFAWGVDAYEDVRVPAGTFKAFRIGVAITPP